MDLPKPKPKAKAKPAPSRKRKAEEEHAPTRRSGRLAGAKAEPVSHEEFLAVEQRALEEREAQRRRDRRPREQVMSVAEQMQEDSAPVAELEALLRDMPLCERPDTKAAKDAYPDKTPDAELQRLQAQFKGMHLAANKKVTTERVYTMLVHPDAMKNLVLVGDKYGQLGVWDAPTGKAGGVKAEDEVKTEVKEEAKAEDGEEEEEEDGRVWRLQAHAKNSISCMKVDPVNGQSVSCPMFFETDSPADHLVIRLHAAEARL